MFAPNDFVRDRFAVQICVRISACTHILRCRTKSFGMNIGTIIHCTYKHTRGDVIRIREYIRPWNWGLTGAPPTCTRALPSCVWYDSTADFFFNFSKNPYFWEKIEKKSHFFQFFSKNVFQKFNFSKNIFGNAYFVQSGTTWNILEHPGTSWNILEQPGTTWNNLEHPETTWNNLLFY